MTIIVANDYAFVEGGASLVSLTQATGLAERGHNVILFAAQRSRDNAGESGWLDASQIPTWITGQWDIASNPNRIDAARQGIWNQVAAVQLGRILDQQDKSKTIVLLHSWTKALSGSVVRCARAHHVPVVAILHDYFVSCPNGAYHDFQERQHCDRKPMSVRCALANCDRQGYAEKAWRVVRHFVQENAGQLPQGLAAVVCVSQYQKNILQSWLPKALTCHVLPNLVAPPPAGISARVGENRAFIFVGRFSPERGALLFANAARDAGVDAVFVGEGSERGSISASLPTARITGWLGQESVWRELARARALVNPIHLHEAFGLSVYQAAALGIPAIVPDSSATSDFINHRKNGLHFRQGDTNDLAKNITELAVNPALAIELGQQAKQDYERYYASTVSYYTDLESILFSAMIANSLN